MSGQDGQQVLVKYGSNYVRVHPCRLALERNHNDKNLYNISDPDMQHNNIQQQPRSVDPNRDTYLDSDSDTEQDSQNENENNSDKDMNILSNSIERLSVTEPNLSQTDTNTDKILHPELKKNVNVRFKFNNSDEWNTAKLISRAGKAAEKYSKAWNSQFIDGSIKSIDFERDVSGLKNVKIIQKQMIIQLMI